MKKFCLLISLSITTLASYAQKVSDILENGIDVKGNYKVYFLKSDGTNFKYSVGRGDDFHLYNDSSIFLVHTSDVSIYEAPLNPLKYSYNTTMTQIVDPINAAADKAFTSITSLLTTVTGSTTPAPGAPSSKTKKDKNVKKQHKSAATSVAGCDFSTIKADLKTIADKLKSDPKERMNKVFSTLRDSIDFSSKQRTNDTIKAAGDSIKTFKSYFDDLATAVSYLEKDVNNFTCTAGDSLISKYVLLKILDDTKTSLNVKKTRLQNLQRAFKLVKDAADNAGSTSHDREDWYNAPVTVKATNGKISITTITVNYSGLELKNGEIVSTTSKEYFKKVLRLRRYQTFIFEVSAGVAYTTLSFPKYGITTDAAGKSTVSSAGSDNFKKLNFTAMLNAVYYSGSNVSPFIQLGIGAKTDYPTLLMGGGARFDISGKTLAFSLGGAATWYKGLTKLHIGDQVSGTSQLESDLSYQFQFPKVYFGIQYNF